MDWSGVLVLVAIAYCVAHYAYNTHKLNKQFNNQFSKK